MKPWRQPVFAAAVLIMCNACSSSGSSEAKTSSNETSAAGKTGSVEHSETQVAPSELPPAPPVPAAPRGLPPTPSPEHNPTTADKRELGRLLFFDKRLSRDHSASCSSCHQPARSFGDPNRLSRTVDGKLNLRHAPSLLNIAYANDFYWDGRISPLEAVVLASWQGQLGATPATVVGQLNDDETYLMHFRRAFHDSPTPAHVAEALSAYLRTLRSGDSSWDRHEAGLYTVADSVTRGAELFRGKARCAQCHPPPIYTDEAFHNVGIGEVDRDPGRARITGRAEDTGAFRTPSLRGAAASAPYFHDGSAPTLSAALSHGEATAPAILSPAERADLSAFVLALTP